MSNQLRNKYTLTEICQLIPVGYWYLVHTAALVPVQGYGMAMIGRTNGKYFVIPR